MKFYYNNKLVRTSKNHHYTHAVKWADSEKALACNGSYDLAVKERNSYISFYFKSEYEFYKAMYEAKLQGKEKFYWKSKYSSSNYRKVADNCEEKYNWHKEAYENAQKNIIIVELEERD